MFYHPELFLLSDPYFTVIRMEEDRCSLQSKCTGHCWIIWKNYNAKPFRIELHHKHHVCDPYYHIQCRKLRTVRDAIAVIKKHDRYVLNHQNKKSGDRTGNEPM